MMTNDSAMDRKLQGLTEEQRSAVRSQAPMTVVSAGAGTGKTHTLKNRFAWLIASSGREEDDAPLLVDQILTLTFTQTAAQNMREKIFETIAKWRDDKELSACLPKLRESGASVLDDALDRSEEAYISTIHSFARRVLREAGLELDIDPSLGLVSTPVEKRFWAWIAREIEVGRVDGIAEQLGGEITRDTILDVMEFYGAAAIADAAKQAAEKFGSDGRVPEYVGIFTKEHDREIIRTILGMERESFLEFADLWHDIYEVYRATRSNKNSQYCERIKTFAEKYGTNFTRSACGTMSDEELAHIVSDMRATVLNDPRGGIKKEIEECPAIKDWFDRKRGRDTDCDSEKERTITNWRKDHSDAVSSAQIAAGGEVLTETEELVRRVILAAIRWGWERWESFKNDAGVMTFADMVRSAIDTIRNVPDYGRRFRHVMIDEYQDTDGAQDSMVRTLAGLGTDGRGSDGNDIYGADAAKLFLVGDIKQSIYRFRNANPALFAVRTLEAKDRVGGAVSIPINKSFRMNAKLIEAVNTVFEHVWRKGVIALSVSDGREEMVEYEPLIAPENNTPEWQRRCETMPENPLEIIVPSDTVLKAAEMRDTLARAVANRTVELMESGAVVWEEKDEKKGIQVSDARKLEWRDICVLVPSRTSYQSIERAFEAAGIPVTFARNREFFGRGEVKDIVNALAAAYYQDSSSALSGWMEAPWSGVPSGASIEMLAEAKRDRSRKLRDIFKERYEGAYQRFVRFRSLALIRSASSAVFSLLDDRTWIDRYPPAVRCRVELNVRHSAELLREYEISLGRDLSAETNYLLEAMKDRDSQAEEPNDLDTGDKVTVMTIHASKGLEFPVVFVMGMERIPEVKQDPIMITDELGVTFSRLPEELVPGDSEKPRGKSLVKRLMQKGEAEEFERLLYVAMTRARDRLICVGGYDEKKSGSWMSMLRAANEENGSPFPEHRAGADDKILKVEVRVTERETEPLLAPAARTFSTPTLASFSASAFMAMDWCPHAYRLKYRQGARLSWSKSDGDHTGGADVGTLAHWILMRWDFTPISADRYLADDTDPVRLPSYLRAVFADRRERLALRNRFIEFAESPACSTLRDLLGRGLLKREMHFSVEEDGIVLAGSIDLLWHDDHGLHIRDWKTTSSKSEANEMYGAQLDFYAMAADHFGFKGSGIDVGLLHLDADADLGGTIVGDLDEIRKRVVRAAQLAASGPFEKRLDYCPRCPYRKKCMNNTR